MPNPSEIIFSMTNQSSRAVTSHRSSQKVFSLNSKEDTPIAWENRRGELDSEARIYVSRSRTYPLSDPQFLMHELCGGFIAPGTVDRKNCCHEGTNAPI